MIETRKLPNGITLITDHMDGIRSTAIGIMCNTGSSNERPEEYGISHFIEHMLFKGTLNRTPYEIVDEIDSMGGEVNAFTGKEVTCFYVKCLDEHLYKSADVLVDMIENPLFDANEMEREKLVVIEEINMTQDDPDDVAMDALEEYVYAGSGFDHPVLGTKDTVSAFTRDMLVEYYREHYTKDSIVVSVAGSFDIDELEEYFSSKFLNLEGEQRKDRTGKLDAITDNKVIVKDVEQAHIVLGVPSVSATHKYRYVLSMISTILGGGMSSRLFQHVREEKGLAYSIYSMNSFYTNCGSFIIAAGVAKDRVEEALEAIKIELDKLANEPVNEHEFSSAKEQLKAAYIFSKEAVKSRMTGNARNYFALGYCPDQDEILGILDKISQSDIEDAKLIISDYSKYSFINVTGKMA